MNALTPYVVVAVAGSIGAVTRLAVGQAAARLFGAAFPWGTLAINVTGSFAIGWFLSAFGDRYGPDHPARLAAVTGFLGAYTTFSAFTYETLALARTGGAPKAAAYVAVSVALGLLAAGAGMAAGGRG